MIININPNKKAVTDYYNSLIRCGVTTVEKAKNQYRLTRSEIEYVELTLASIGGMELVKKANVTLHFDGFLLEIDGVEGNIAWHTDTFYKPECWAESWDDVIRTENWCDAIETLMSANPA